MDFTQYLAAVLPCVWPWLLSLLILGLTLSGRSAERMLKIDQQQASYLAMCCTWCSVCICGPISLYVPLWSFINIPIYYVLALGMHAYIASKIVPEVSATKRWRWAWAANFRVIMWSTIAWMLCLMPGLGFLMR